MYCIACNLHYPDQLNFCPRCGQALARAIGEAPVESTFCTRCGARVVSDKELCEQCGFRCSVAPELTISGACYHCGTSWYTGWFFCKNCGLDRNRALLLSTATPFAPSAPASRPESLEEWPEVVKVCCKHCGVEAKPYSRFCEACGCGLARTEARRVSTTPVSVPAETQVEMLPPSQHPASPVAPPLPISPVLPAPPTLTEPPIVMPPTSAIVPRGALLSDAVAKISSRATSATVTINNKAPWVAERSPLPAGEDKLHASVHLPTNYAPADNLPISRRPTTTVPAPETLAAGLITAPEMQNKGWRLARPTIALAALLILLLGAVAAWWRWRNASHEVASLSAISLPQASPAQSLSQTPAAATTASAAADMIFISGGQFMMGRDGRDKFESPARSVTVHPFYLDRTEVTNQEYQKFVTASGRDAPAHWQGGKFPIAEANFPVVNVSWNDAQAYAKWAQKRLPSEAEWEFAARGTAGWAYPWGNDWRQGFANADHTQGGHISEVGCYPQGATPQGLLDMCGNVWEWTANGLVSYADGKKELAPGKVIRGGAFDGPRELVTMTYRGVLPADAARDKTGFRCARDAQ